MRSTFLPFAVPDVNEDELQQVAESLQNGWLTTGPKTKEFEQRFSSLVGANYAIALNSCTAAMHLALEAIGLQPGDEVITSPYTFAATAEVVRYFDAKPVFVDVSAGCLNISPSAIKAAITPRTKAIIPVHIAGLPADLNPIAEIARKHNLAIIEDAAHAFPSHYQGRNIGRAIAGVTHFVCYSFYATKTITTGEGGMLCTDNEELADRCRIMALHGISRDAWKRYTAEGTWKYEIIAPGYKYNLTDIASGIGLAQLTKSDKMWARRKDIAERYNRAFQNHPALQLPVDRADCQHAWHLYIIRLNLECLSIDRAKFYEELKQKNIGTSVHFIPLHIHPYYRDKYGYSPEDYPVAFREYTRAISLPIYSRMSDVDVDDTINAVLEVARLHALSPELLSTSLSSHCTLCSNSCQ